jgi:hypothetical protein
MARAANDESSLVSWLEAADKAGRLSVPKPELAAKIFWAMASGALFWPQLLEGPMNPEARDVLVDELVSTFLARYRSVFG